MMILPKILDALNIICWIGIFFSASGLDSTGSGWIKCMIAVFAFLAVLLLVNSKWFYRAVDGFNEDYDERGEDDEW